MNNDKAIEQFLKNNVVKPHDNGFSEHTMKLIAQKQDAKKKQPVRWSIVLQYACYTLVGIIIAYFYGKGLLTDILTAPTYPTGFLARILKDGLYIVMIGLSIITYTICNIQYKE